MAAPKPLVLIGDDRADVVETLRLLLEKKGFATQGTSSPSGIVKAVKEREFDVLLMDMNYTQDTTSGEEGLDILDRIRELDPSLPVIVMTAWGSVGGAVEAMRRGATDYLEKPWDNTRLLTTVRTQVELARTQRRTRRLESRNRVLEEGRCPAMIASSPAMRPVLDLIERVAPSSASVLITGEHGTGKEVVARHLHARSERASRPMITVNAGAIAQGVFESELFGHVKGAFTDARSDRTGSFELAHEGTLFLDEIGTMAASQQAKLLRVLQTGEFQPVGSSRTKSADVRLLSATNVDLSDEIRQGRFREDLLFRLNTVEIRLPPLRERRADIMPLARHFLDLESKKYRKEVVDFSAEAREALEDHAWPGNVRELEQTVERAVLLAEGPRIEAEDLRMRCADTHSPDLEELTLQEVERTVIRKALTRNDGNVKRTAEALGLSRSALYRRLERYGL